MAYRLLVILFLAFSGYHTARAQPVVINAKLDNISNNQLVYLYRSYGPKYEKADSAVTDEGRFSFQYPEGLPRGFYKIGIDEAKSITLILGEESLNIEGDLNQPQSVRYQNSPENKLFR